MNKHEAGSRGENLAASYLTGRGYRILEQNFRCRQGEIDLIAMDGAYLVFIEVKYRRSLQNGEPAEAVGYQKQQRIIHTARYYLYTHGYGEDVPCRFDVVSIAGSRIQVIRDAFGT
ncbi:MAG: YraN family protein [Lachnospiraceae bacterium]|nr:YraN family protein [Lachnospiraceae bacterium]